MSENDIVIKLQGVSKKYKLFENKTDRMKEALYPFNKIYHKEFYALKDINLEVRKGEILGIVGMNGSGKSTLLTIIAGIILPTTGSVEVAGNIVPLLELGSGFNPEFTGLENIYFYNSILGFTRKETDAMIGKILAFAEIGEFINQPVKNYSSGMKARLSFAVSVNIKPDILIVDEVLSVGDELFRRKSFSKIEEFFKEGKTILFVSHSEGNINQLCSRVVMLHQGRIVLEGKPKFVTMNYSKFIFSDLNQREILLTEFKKTTCKPSLLQGIADELPNPDHIRVDHEEVVPKKDVPYFIPNYVPKSTTITSNADLTVSEPLIETPDGLKVNALVQNEIYIFKYKVIINEDLGPVNFGIGFKTEKGIQLSWKVYPGKNKYLSTGLKNGGMYTFSWTFKCLFMPGPYFINIGIRRLNGDSEQLLFKGADFFVFKVLGPQMIDKGGLFDVGLSLSINQS